MSKSIISRTDYSKGRLVEEECPSNPYDLFGIWLEDAIKFYGNEPAMVLSTVDTNNRPSSRVVLLKGHDLKGLYFYTSYSSRKGQDLANNPYAAVNLFWPELERQIRLSGIVARLTSIESEHYFNSRPEDSKISAIISPQSQPVPDRDFLLQKHENIKREYRSGLLGLDRPADWGGYVFSPGSFEFWVGQPNRLNDRIFYEFIDGGWTRCRLAP